MQRGATEQLGAFILPPLSTFQLATPNSLSKCSLKNWANRATQGNFELPQTVAQHAVGAVRGPQGRVCSLWPSAKREMQGEGAVSAH